MVETGGDTWFFLTADYAFGHALERDTAAVVEAAGGKVLGAVRHPLSTSDFSSFLLHAQASGAKALGLPNARGDTIHSIKKAAGAGVVAAGPRLHGRLISTTAVTSRGRETAGGRYLPRP